MTPYFQKDGFTIYHGECREVLALLAPGSVDAVITDPPYSSGGLMRGDRMMNPVAKYCQNGNALGRISFSGDNRDQRSWMTWSSIWMGDCRRIVRNAGYMLCFTDWRMLPSCTDAFQIGGFVWRGIVVWNKGRGSRAPHKGYFRHQCEYVVWGTNGECPKAEHDGPYDGCIDATVRQNDKFHITGKPTALMQQLCRVVPEGGLILDPFMGSGTTLVGAQAVGRRAIGIELEEKNCEIAAQRLERALEMGVCA